MNYSEYSKQSRKILRGLLIRIFGQERQNDFHLFTWRAISAGSTELEGNMTIPEEEDEAQALSQMNSIQEGD